MRTLQQIRSIFNRVNLSVVESFLIISSAFFIEAQEITIGSLCVSIVRTDYIDVLLGASAVKSTIWKIVGIMYECGGKDEGVVNINGGMFFRP